jgi:outer membrane protein
MNIRIIILVLILACLQIHKLSAQEAWGLNQCIIYSLENNISLKNAEINQELQQVKLSQAKLNQLPQIGANTGINESYGRTVDPATNTYSDINNFDNSYSLGASATLFSGFSQRNRIAFERFNLKAEKNRYEQQKNIIIYNVIDAYLNLLLKKGIYSLSLDNLKLMQEQYNSIKKYIEVGRKAESDIYEFDAKLATDSFLFVQQAGDFEKATLLLKTTMNYPISDTLIIDSLPLPLNAPASPLDPESLVEAAKQQLPDFKITENQLFAAKKYLAQVRGSFSPNIGIYSGWNTKYYNTSGQEALLFENQFKNNAGENIGVSLSIPIFDRFSRINALHSANLQYERAANIHQENIIYLEREINEAYIDWQTAINEYSAAQKQLDKSKIAFVTSEKKLSIGQINVIEFYIQKNDLLRAGTELLRTQLQLSLKERYIQFLLAGNWGF